MVSIKANREQSYNKDVHQKICKSKLKANQKWENNIEVLKIYELPLRKLDKLKQGVNYNKGIWEKQHISISQSGQPEEISFKNVEAHILSILIISCTFLPNVSLATNYKQ